MESNNSVDVEDRGEYVNIFTNDNLRVSISESYDEVLIYRNDIDNPVANFSFEDGKQRRL